MSKKLEFKTYAVELTVKANGFRDRNFKGITYAESIAAAKEHSIQKMKDAYAFQFKSGFTVTIKKCVCFDDFRIMSEAAKTAKNKESEGDDE